MENKFVIKGDIAEIECYFKGQPYVFTVDAEDIPRLMLPSGRYWGVKLEKGQKPYAIHRQGRLITPMHDVIIEVPKGKVADHIDRDPTNNRKTNLRPATRRQNAWNSSIKSKTGHRCVQQIKNGKFVVRVGIGSYEVKQVGTYTTIEEAVQARDQFLYERNL